MHRITLLIAAVAAFVTSSFALNFPNVLPMLRRESIEPGSPLYECHADCGGVILISQDSDDYCSNSTYKSELSDCLKCALTYNIWQYYGDDVASAAEACGDSATPGASSATGAAATATGASNYSATNIGTRATITSTATTSSSSSSATSTSGSTSTFSFSAVVLVIAAVAGMGSLA
ncbi:hypothetical protein BO94DRAFT_574877 [Aspergillus sclerotioniger CBS 115572]|uniref:GPI anchored protein n=1 Tax=Aspergillus sclerotioniger CBS 115572 TaxID=1450535 RepID=A0A317WS65_9EURO|nr:hypothetical protein BO94DRAFT_574877 [Aspergillus sclerotioniger CBS 115572]PWY88875.1 hypothetical protein BO94DRAFT_574877 [Aspergillus sclerotioniger CBS 115572]